MPMLDEQEFAEIASLHRLVMQSGKPAEGFVRRSAFPGFDEKLRRNMQETLLEMSP